MRVGLRPSWPETCRPATRLRAWASSPTFQVPLLSIAQAGSALGRSAANGRHSLNARAKGPGNGRARATLAASLPPMMLPVRGATLMLNASEAKHQLPILAHTGCTALRRPRSCRSPRLRPPPPHPPQHRRQRRPPPQRRQ